MDDPDRWFTKEELQEPSPVLRRWYARFCYPTRRTRFWNPMLWLFFLTYVTRHLIAVFTPVEKRPSFIAHSSTYSHSQRVRVIAELACIAALQCGVFVAAGMEWEKYLWASPIAVCFTSVFVMGYVWTNHYLHGLYEADDPVASSTSVAVHPVLDVLHSHFSYHTEHHLFPSINSDYYPAVSELLKAEFSDRYNRLPILEAWRRLFRNEPYIE